MKNFEVYHTETGAVKNIKATLKTLPTKLEKVFGKGFWLYQPNTDENFIGSFEVGDNFYHIYGQP